MVKKVLTVLGARPQFIKASVVSRAFSAVAGELSEYIVHTGQHYDSNMSDIFFSGLSLPEPKRHLGIHGGGHGAMTGQMLMALEEVMLAERPDAVLIYGDTNSTLAGALAAAKLHIPVAHVEAGLRSFNMRMPEEINRILSDRVSNLLFAPTDTAVANLLNEGISREQIIQSGDVMFDAAIVHGSAVAECGGVISSLALEPCKYVLATVHRAENTDDLERLTTIVRAIEEVSRQLKVVWPVHPRTRSVLTKHGLWESLSERICITEPLSYIDMVQLEKYAAVIATDSGGVQKEAFFHGVPCVTLRDETEWTELVDAGWVRIASPVDAGEVAASILDSVGRTGKDVQPYGAGNAAGLIVEKIRSNLS